ncbi:hypothetical protein [Armatimonas sp.]
MDTDISTVSAAADRALLVEGTAPYGIQPVLSETESSARLIFCYF